MLTNQISKMYWDYNLPCWAIDYAMAAIFNLRWKAGTVPGDSIVNLYLLIYFILFIFLKLREFSFLPKLYRGLNNFQH